MEHIANTNGELGERTGEFNNLRQDYNMLEGRNYGERKDIERLEHDVRDQQALSHKNYQDINRLKDIGGSRDSENRSLKIRMDNMQNEIE